MPVFCALIRCGLWPLADVDYMEKARFVQIMTKMGAKLNDEEIGELLKVGRARAAEPLARRSLRQMCLRSGRIAVHGRPLLWCMRPSQEVDDNGKIHFQKLVDVVMG